LFERFYFRFFFIIHGRNLWKFYLFEIVYLHCLSIRKKKLPSSFFFFSFFLLGIIVTSNRIHIEKKNDISLLPLILSYSIFFLLLPTQEDFCRNIHFFFFSLFDKALCKLCAFSSNVSLSLSVLWCCLKKADGVSPVCLCLLLLSLSPFFSVVVI